MVRLMLVDCILNRAVVELAWEEVLAAVAVAVEEEAAEAAVAVAVVVAAAVAVVVDRTDKIS